MKKMLFVILSVLALFSPVLNVYARVLTMNEVTDRISETEYFKTLKLLGVTSRFAINEGNKTLDGYVTTETGEKKFVSINYTNDYIEYTNPVSSVNSDEAMFNEFYNSVLVFSVVEAILDVSGYDGKTVNGEGDYTNTYDEYGFKFTLESYSYSDGTSSASGQYLKYLKMSLDTDKIDKLMAKYGVDEAEADPNKEAVAKIKPTITAGDITENSITLYPHIEYKNIDPDYTIFCYVYRSTDEFIGYEKVSDMAINCSDEIGLNDENLQSGTTYYYKTVFMYGNLFSDPIKVETLSNKKEIKEPGKPIDTGISDYFVELGVILILGISLYTLSIKKENLTEYNVFIFFFYTNFK